VRFSAGDHNRLVESLGRGQLEKPTHRASAGTDGMVSVEPDGFAPHRVEWQRSL